MNKNKALKILYNAWQADVDENSSFSSFHQHGLFVFNYKDGSFFPEPLCEYRAGKKKFVPNVWESDYIVIVDDNILAEMVFTLNLFTNDKHDDLQIRRSIIKQHKQTSPYPCLAIPTNALCVNQTLIESTEETQLAFDSLIKENGCNIVFDSRSDKRLTKTIEHIHKGQSNATYDTYSYTYSGVATNYIIDALYGIKLSDIWRALVSNRDLKYNIKHSFLRNTFYYMERDAFYDDMIVILNMMNICLMQEEYIEIDIDKIKFLPGWKVDMRRTISKWNHTRNRDVKFDFVEYEDEEYANKIEKKLERIEDIFSLWNYASSRANVAFLLDPKKHLDIERFRKEILYFGEMIGVNSLIEAYSMGVPARDLII